MMNDINNTEKDPYEGGYTDEGPFKAESKEGNAYYIILKATLKELMIMMNYWRYLLY